MARQTWIAERLRSFGLRVEEYAGWTTRGSSTFSPHGVVIHWTAGPCGATGRPSLHTVVNGRADLPGPLANVYLDRAGICVVVAAGRANHAGAGGWHGLSSNSDVLGIEAECCHEGDWTAAQTAVYPTVAGALAAGCGAPVSNVIRHCDWAPKRKIDTRDLSLAWLQTNAKAAMEGGGKPPEEDDVRQICVQMSDGRVYASDGLTRYLVPNPDDLAAGLFCGWYVWLNDHDGIPAPANVQAFVENLPDSDTGGGVVPSTVAVTGGTLEFE